MKILILLFVSLFCLQITVFAQNKLVDSLENVLKQTVNKDTIRINLLNLIAYEVRNADGEKSLKHATEAGELSDNLKFNKGKAESLRLKGIYYFIRTDLQKAMEFYKEGLAISQKIGFQSGIAKCSGNMASIFQRQGDFQMALKLYMSALAITEKLNDKVNISKLLTNIGGIYLTLGNYPKAVEIFQKALKINNDLNDKYNMSQTLVSLGSVYYLRKDYVKALEYFSNALKIKEELGDKVGTAITSAGVGNMYLFQKDYVHALEYYQKALNIHLEMSNKEGIAFVYNSIANVYSNQTDFAKALEFYQKSLQIALENKLNQYEAQNYDGISDCYFKQKKTSEALNYAQKAYQLGKEMNHLEILKSSSEKLAEIYAVIGSYKDAYKYHIEFKRMNDTLLNENNIKQITNAENQYKFDKEKQATELEQQKKDAIATADKQKRTVVMYSFIIGFLLMLILALVVYRSYLQKQKTNIILTKQKREIEDKNEELQQQKEEILTQAEELQTTNEKLIELSEFKEGMTGMIVHDLKNPLNSILNNDNLARIKQAGKQMLTMVMNILDVQKFEDSKMKLELVNHSAYNVAQNAYNQVEMLIKEKNITFENKLNPKLGIKTEPEILERVFVNLLTNATKYTPNNGKIVISEELKVKSEELKKAPVQLLTFNSQLLTLKISDTGQGIPSDKLHLVFEKFGQVEAKKSGGIRSTGLGLTFCKLAVEAHGGEIGVESELGVGTTFWFTVPLGNAVTNPQGFENLAGLPAQTAETFTLTLADKEIILPLVSQLKALEVYEVSDIRNILKNIDIANTPALQHWVEEMQNAIRAGNEELYAELLNKIETRNEKSEF